MRFWVQRIATAVLLLVAVSALTFTAMNVLGDPLVNILGPAAGDTSPQGMARVEQARQQYHLDDPLPVRYARWAGDFVSGDMGVQFGRAGQPPVAALVEERIPRTVMLLAMAQLFAALVAVPWALWSASRSGSLVDRTSTVVAFTFIALPNFALAVILKYVLAVRYQLLPQTFDASDPFWSRAHQLLLPAMTIGLPAAAVYQRLLRTDLVATLQEDFILAARAKGVPRRRVLLRHALRPSLFSFVTAFALNTGALMGGALVVENIFRVPGLGSAVVEAILRDDFPVVLAIVMVTAAALVALNLVVDVLYTVIDPRVRR